MLIYINFFHVNMHEISFKIIIWRGWWIHVSLSLHSPKDLDSFPASKRALTRNRYEVPVQPCRFAGSEEQAGTTLPSDPTTNRSDLSPWHILHSSLHRTQKVNKQLCFRGDKSYTVLRHTELVTSHESVGLSGETLKKGGGEEREPLTGTNYAFLQVSIMYH